MSQVSFVRDNGTHQTKEGYRGQNPVSKKLLVRYGVATISRLLKMIGLFCKRALYKRSYSAKDTYIRKKPTIHSHPICYACRHFLVCVRARMLCLSLANAHARSLSFPSLSRSLLLAGFLSCSLSLSLTLSHSQARTPIHSLSIFLSHSQQNSSQTC